MTTKLVAASSGSRSQYLVEVSPERILYEMSDPINHGPVRFSLPMPWLYVGVYGWDKPYFLLAAHFPISIAADPLGLPPLLGLQPGGTMCTTPMRIPRAGSGRQEDRLLAAVTGALASGGNFGYMHYLRAFQSFKFLALGAGVKIPSFHSHGDWIAARAVLWNEVFVPVYSYWESLDNFPGNCPLAGKTIIDFGFRDLLKEPQLLAD